MQGRKHLRRAERAAHAGEDAVRAAEEAATGEAKTEDMTVSGRLPPSVATGDAINCSRGVCCLSGPFVLLQIIQKSTLHRGVS